MERVIAALVAAAALAGAAVGTGAAATAAPPTETTTARLVTIGVTAAQHGRSDCGDLPPESPGAGRDGWVFQAPGRFRTVRLTFTESAGGTTTIEKSAGEPSDAGGRFFDNGTEVWISTPAGWTLVGGSATIAGGAAPEFRLIRTCWGQEPMTAVRGPAAAGPGAEQKIVVVVAPTSRTSPPVGDRPGHHHAAGPAGHLPKTGPPAALLAGIGLAFIAIGAGLRRIRNID